MKKIIAALFALFTLSFAFCQEEKSFEVTLRITNVKTSEGKIFVSIHDSEKNFKSRVPVSALAAPAKEGEVLIKTRLAPGECAFCVYHDVNSNGKLDSGVFGIPKEPFGFSNYDGKSPPGNFERHKRAIFKDETILIPLVKF